MIILEALGLKKYKQIFNARLVNAERLTAFQDNPVDNGPKVHRTMIDLSYPKPSDNVKKSRWNAALIAKLSMLAALIVSTSRNPKRFGDDFASLEHATAWQDCITDRIYELCRTYCAGYPKGGETIANVEKRLEEVWLGDLKRKGVASMKRAVCVESSILSERFFILTVFSV